MKASIYTNLSECSGCRACVEICPLNCISMIKDTENFEYPIINEKVCVNCKKCEKVCPLKQSEYNNIKKAVVGVHSANEVYKSSSGGAFWALCQILIPQGYVVAGVKYTDKFMVVHDIAYTLEEAQAFRKSKYIMPNTYGIFTKVKSLLKDGYKVMFTGSPCQVAACKKFIGNNENLLLVDLVCHGAPNQDVFNKEIEYLELKHKGKLESFEFRNKEPINGCVNSRSAKYIIDNQSYIVEIKDDPFLNGYYSRLFYRPSCGTCHFARPERVSDITIADAWGIKLIYPEFNDLKGTSLILLNTEKGINLYDSLKEKMKLLPVEIQWAIDSNQQLKTPTSFHKNRQIFFENFNKISFNNNIKVCTYRSVLDKILFRIHKIIKKCKII